MKLDTKQRKIVEALCSKYKLSEEEVLEIIELPFKFIRTEIKSIEFTGKETEEEFEEKSKNFNIPCIGKLYANYNAFKHINNDKESN